MTEFDKHAHKFTHVWARPGQPVIIDFADADGRTLHFGKTSEQMRAEFPTAQFRLFDEWKTEMHARENPPVQWIPIAPRVYTEALTVLPPAAARSGAFLLGDPVDHYSRGSFERFWGYRRIGEEYQQSSRPMTIREFDEAFPPAAAGAAPGSPAQ